MLVPSRRVHRWRLSLCFEGLVLLIAGCQPTAHGQVCEKPESNGDGGVVIITVLL
jgi:hypothetical protein